VRGAPAAGPSHATSPGWAKILPGAGRGGGCRVAIEGPDVLEPPPHLADSPEHEQLAPFGREHLAHDDQALDRRGVDRLAAVEIDDDEVVVGVLDAPQAVVPGAARLPVEPPFDDDFPALGPGFDLMKPQREGEGVAAHPGLRQESLRPRRASESVEHLSLFRVGGGVPGGSSGASNPARRLGGPALGERCLMKEASGFRVDV
jgi:hypothetical protein